MIFRAVISAVRADIWKLRGRGSLVMFLATEIESGVVISWFSSLFFSLTAFLTLSSLQQITTKATALPRKRVPPTIPRTQTVPHFAISAPEKAFSNINVQVYNVFLLYQSSSATYSVIRDLLTYFTYLSCDFQADCWPWVVLGGEVR